MRVSFQPAAATMVAVLAAYGSVLWLRLRVDVVVLAVVLAVTLGRPMAKGGLGGPRGGAGSGPRGDGLCR